MDPFWQFAKRMLEYRLTLTWALVFAFFSAASLGAGLVSLIPILRVILGGEDAQSLAALAREHNAADPLIVVPAWVINALPTEPFPGVVLIIIVMGILTIIGASCNFLHQFLSQTVCTRTVANIRADTFRRVIEMPLLGVVQRGPSQLIARIVRDTVELRDGFIALTSKSIAQVTKGLAAFAVAMFVDFALTIMAIIIVPLLAIVLRKIGKRIRRGSRGALRAQEGLLRISSEALQGLRVVKANTAERRTVKRFDAENDEVVRQELRVRTARAASGPILETLAIFVIGGLAIFAAHRILTGVMPFDRFVVALTALAVAGGSFRPLAGFVTQIQAASAPAGRLKEILDEAAPEEVPDAPDLPPHATSLEFESISFTYPGSDEPALRDVTLRVPHGERVAIVGPNGSGKTTLLSLVPRLLDPVEGVVKIDGTDIATVRVSSLRQQIGVVTQETVLFRGTVAENIAFGCEHATRERLIEAARQARADAFIQAIPGGYDANILEQGASLSGGQRQRIAIARAILRDPAILILDEATSQIDAESEAEITGAMHEFCMGRTTLIIAHRLSTVRNADRIVVLDRGSVVDAGTHEQLLARCDLYARLSRTQLAMA